MCTALFTIDIKNDWHITEVSRQNYYRYKVRLKGAIIVNLTVIREDK